MLALTVICVGRLKERYLIDACDEYKKRLSVLCKLNIIEIPPQKLSDSPSQSQIKKALELEGKKIIEKIPNNSKIYALCIEGSLLSSEQLSDALQQAAVDGKNTAVFIIGSSCGLSDEVKNRSDVRLSMSKMTFPHQLARVMLLEQLYRATQISIGTKYHK